VYVCVRKAVMIICKHLCTENVCKRNRILVGKSKTYVQENVFGVLKRFELNPACSLFFFLKVFSLPLLLFENVLEK
jgi:hypothetical protein